ncbi:MAG: pantoate kinase [Candidatus Heimdallarchaeaceae archaeon]
MTEYWVAGHITGIFEICDQYSDPLYKGSKGAGFSISRGVKTRVQFSDDKRNHIFFNDKELPIENANVSYSVLRRYLGEFFSKSEIDFGINIYHNFSIPLSSGFGASAAGALGLSFALSDFFDLNLEERQIYQIAHVAEVLEGGGLGDIIALFHGGWELRVKEGAPYIGKVIDLKEDVKYIVATLSFGELKTKAIIRDEVKKKLITKAGRKALLSLKETPTVSSFARRIKNFTLASGILTPEVEEVIQKFKDANGLHLGQIMLGNGLIILAEKEAVLQDIPGIKIESICKETVKKISS